MSIRPIQIAPPALSPPYAGRQTDSPAPAAPEQSGASAVDPAPAPGTNPGTTSASEIAPTEARPTETRGEAPDPRKLAEALERAQELVDTAGRDLAFTVHEKTGEVVVRIIDRQSKEVIRQIPTEEMLRLAEQLKALEGENKPGLLLRQEV